MLEYYPMVKHLHMTLAMLSILGFIFRWILALLKSPMLNKKWLKITPHIIDTCLLAAAILLCVMLQQYPIAQDWLSAKVVLLVVYIVLGIFALKRAPNQLVRLVAGLAAIAVFAQLLAVAFSRSPLGMFA
ncbi:SirB2 family protein [Agarivorans sp. 1_MG-2023]|uniref:SirB2 family protein n=1 Tax=Agarivorans sp. 1_MG-2023 TaxID=3062634 RepID=UPI0026E38123|nr:SirB2 family protein [Agarivorans sp. 1_MG-2023]MDO6764900.1 SirB2 family protein [Agarivorans sp. 1_MG-2023]